MASLYDVLCLIMPAILLVSIAGDSRNIQGWVGFVPGLPIPSPLVQHCNHYLTLVL